MHLGHRRQPGQSIVLLALMMVVVVGMTGLSVDVGNAYAQQRRVQNAANAGAMAGMNAVLNKQTNIEVWNSVQESLASNRVDTDSADYTYQADYLRKDGTVTPLGKWNGTTVAVTAGTSMPPAVDTLARVKVTVTERVPTYFARVVGRSDFTVNENGEACLGSYGIGVYPIGVPFELQFKVNRSGAGAPERYHRIFRRNPLFPTTSNNALTEITQTSDPAWDSWAYRQNLYIYLPVENWDTDLAGTHIAWLDWNGGSSDADELKKALTFPGTLQGNFVEFADKSNAGTKPGELELGDWIEGGTGVKSGADDQLKDLMDTNKDLLLPMYNGQDKVTGKSAIQIGPMMGRFRVAGFDLNSQQGIKIPPSVPSQKYILLQYIKDATGGNANACS